MTYNLWNKRMILYGKQKIVSFTSAYFTSPFFTSHSAICTAFSAAPFLI